MKRTRAAPFAAALLSATVLAPLPAFADNAAAMALSKGVMFPGRRPELQTSCGTAPARSRPGQSRRNSPEAAAGPGSAARVHVQHRLLVFVPVGNLGYQNAKLPGGMDVGFGYGPRAKIASRPATTRSRSSRWASRTRASPFSSAGLHGPGTIPQTYTNTGQANPTTKDKFLVLVDQNLINIAGKFPSSSARRTWRTGAGSQQRHRHSDDRV